MRSNFECSVILSNTSSEWFPVKSGVRQGCILSPNLFLVVIDWVMRKTTSDQPRGIQWTLFSQLEDLDFADDLAFLSVKLDHLQEKTDRLERYTKQTGLTINTSKTQVMSINATPSSCCRSRSDKDCFHHLTLALNLSLCCESDVQESIFMSLSFRFLLMVSLNRRRGRPLFL